MKIERFNENVLKRKWKPTDKVLRVTVKPFEVLIDNIRDTEVYKQYAKNNNDWKKDDLFYGLEWYVYDTGNVSFEYTLYDGNGNIIEDEKEFDKYVKKIKNYNL